MGLEGQKKKIPEYGPKQRGQLRSPLIILHSSPSLHCGLSTSYQSSCRERMRCFVPLLTYDIASEPKKVYNFRLSIPKERHGYKAE